MSCVAANGVRSMIRMLLCEVFMKNIFLPYGSRLLILSNTIVFGL